MKRFFAIHPLLLLLLLLGTSLLVPRNAEAAVTCTAKIGPPASLNFGNYDPQSATAPQPTATLTWSCTNNTFLVGAAVNVCFSIGAGTAGGGQTNPRQMSGSGSPLQFQIYKDGGHSQVWGSVATNNAVPMTLNIPWLAGTVQGVPIPLYGLMPVGQSGVSAGLYSSSFSGTDAKISFQYNEALFSTPSAPATCGNGNDNSFPFTVTANVQRTCTVTAGAASNIDFGNVPASTTGSISATNDIHVTCLNGTPYIVGLATTDGNNGTGHMTGLDPGNITDKVAYTLHQTSANGPTWGNTGTAPGTATKGNDFSSTGNGLTQTIPVYAVVTDPNHIPGHYRDTVTVNVIY